MTIIFPLSIVSYPEILAFGTGIIGLLSAIVMGIYSFRNSSIGIKNDIIKTYETRLEQVDKDIQELKVQLTEMSTKFDKSEADRKKAEDILNLRNPEFERYMAQSLQLLIEIHGRVTPTTVVK